MKIKSTIYSHDTEPHPQPPILNVFTLKGFHSMKVKLTVSCGMYSVLRTGCWAQLGKMVRIVAWESNWKTGFAAPSYPYLQRISCMDEWNSDETRDRNMRRCNSTTVMSGQISTQKNYWCYWILQISLIKFQLRRSPSWRYNLDTKNTPIHEDQST